MTFKLLDQGEFAVLINGLDMLIGADGLKSCTIIDNTTSAAPTVSMTFVDTRRKAVGQGAFTDGSKIQVIMGDGSHQPITYNFLQWSLADSATNVAGETATISAVANIIPWITKINTKRYIGNVSDVLPQLAQEGGINLTDIDSTQDSMTWLPNTTTLHQFARGLQDHSWAGASASMMMGITSKEGEWQLRLKDILKKGGSDGPRLVSAGLQGPGDLIVWDYRAHSDAMFHNSWVNYGYKVAQEQLNGTLDKFLSMDITALSSNIGISSAASSAVGLVRTLYHAANVGNTHENYALASHNNLKAQSAFTTTVHAMIDRQTSYRLLDNVEVLLAMSDGTINTAYSGLYKVSSISRHISKGNYREKFTLMSQGVNAQFSGA